MSKFEKARIKLLDKNTGQVLKEVDPFTSADAVEYDDKTNVKQKIMNIETDITKYNESNDKNLENLIAKDKEFEKNINNINEENKKQNDSLSTINTTLITVNENIKKINEENKNQNDSLDDIENNTYTKEEANEKFYDKEYISNNLYTKDQTNNKFCTSEYVSNNLYTKTQVNEIQQNINKNIENTNQNTITNMTTQIVKSGNNFARTTGTSNSYSVNFDKITAYEDGLTIVIVPNVDCADHPKIKINNLPYLEIKDSSGDFLSSGDMLNGIPLILVKLGNYFFIRASKKAATEDEVTDTDPSNPSFVTSIPVGGEIVRILNSDEVYMVSGNCLHIVNAKKKKIKKKSEAVFILRPRSQFGGYIDHTLKKWNKYYIYGSRIYDSNFKIVRDYYEANPSIHFERKVKKGKGDYTTLTANAFFDNYIVFDKYYQKPYLIKAIPLSDEFYVDSSYSSNAWWDTWNITYRFEIYEIDSNLNLIHKCNLTNKSLSSATMSRKSDNPRPKFSSPFFKGSQIVAIFKNKIYASCVGDVNDYGFSTSDTYSPIRKGTGIVSLLTFDINTGLKIDSLYGARKHKAGSVNGNTDSEDNLNIELLQSPDGDFIIVLDYKYYYYHSGNKPNKNKKTNGYSSVLYDIETEKELYTYSMSDTDSGRNLETKEPEEKYKVATWTKGFSNNPKFFIGYNGCLGYKLNSKNFLLDGNKNYNYKCITSKYGFIDGSKIDIYKL